MSPLLAVHVVVIPPLDFAVHLDPVFSIKYMLGVTRSETSSTGVNLKSR